MASAPSWHVCTWFARLRCLSARSVSSACSRCPRRAGFRRHLVASALLAWECEIERGALIHFPFRPDPAAVPLHDPLDDREAHAGAVELLSTVQPLEYPEQFVRVPRVKSRAVVLYVIRRLPAIRSGADFDPRAGAVARELRGVLQQIAHHRAQQSTVATSWWQGIDPDLQGSVSPGLGALNVVRHELGQLLHVHR